VHKEILAQPEQAKVHIFSTMFYKRLTLDPEEGSKMDRWEKNSNMSMVEKRHRRVKRWTKNTQLFNKNLVLIPICECSHWYMVVLVRPGAEQPCMMVLDSLGGDNTRAVYIIMKYLEIEGREKLGEKALVNLKEMKVVRPNIPQQRNGFDCGVFLLHYAEKMLERPDQFYTFNSGNLDLTDWFPTSEVDRKRSHMAKLVRQLADEQAQGRTVSFPDLALSLEDTNIEVTRCSTTDVDQDENKDDNKLNNQDPSATPPVPFHDTTLSQNPHISLIIKNELSCLSPVPPPTTHHTRDRIASQAPLFSSPANLWDNSRPAAASAGIQVQEPVRRKGRKLYEKSNLVQPRMVLFTAREYYSDKPSSDRLFDEFLEDEVCDSEEEENIFP